MPAEGHTGDGGNGAERMVGKDTQACGGNPEDEDQVWPGLNLCENSLECCLGVAYLNIRATIERFMVVDQMDMWGVLFTENKGR